MMFRFPFGSLVCVLCAAVACAEYLGKAYHQAQPTGVWLDVKEQAADSGIAPPPPLDSPQNDDSARIFVEIAAFRDDLCGITLRELFSHAKHPERIFIGIVDQTEAGDVPCLEQYCKLIAEHTADGGGAYGRHTGGGLMHMGGYRRKLRKQKSGAAACPFADQVTVHPMKAQDARGPAFARSFQDGLLRRAEARLAVAAAAAAADSSGAGAGAGAGSEMQFCMQIDAHSETVVDWDMHMLREWRGARNEFAVLSTYVSGVASKPKGSILATPAEDPAHEVPVLCATEWGQAGMVRNGVAAAASHLARPMLGCLWGAGLSFARCHAERAVPADPHTAGVFDGEEFTKAARLFTNGYDMYNPSRALIFHNYRVAQASPKRWHGSFTGGETARSYARLLTLLGMEKGAGGGVREQQARTLAEIEREGYGLGTLRTLGQFEAFCGMDLAKRRPATGEKCGVLQWVPWKERNLSSHARVAEIMAVWKSKHEHGPEL